MHKNTPSTSVTHQGRSKFVTIYSRLLSGSAAQDLNSKEEPAEFYASLFCLPVDRGYLEKELRSLPKHVCMEALKVHFAIRARDDPDAPS